MINGESEGLGRAYALPRLFESADGRRLEMDKTMNEKFELVKSELKNVGEIKDIFENPAVKYLLGILNALSYGAVDALDVLFSKTLFERQKQKRKELCEIIFADNLFTREDVEDVEFVLEFARTLDVVNRLATNKKLKYIATLFKRTFSQETYKEHIPEFEEYLFRLDRVSFRELDLLFLLYDSERKSKFAQYTGKEKLDKVWEDYISVVKEKYSLSESMIRSIMSGLVMTGFCHETRIPLLNGSDLVGPYCTTEYFWRFLELIR